MQEVDLDKELAQNDLVLTYDDVQLIIGILYCVGTVDISPPRIKSLLVASQVLGIPTLTRFLKKIDSSLTAGVGAGGGIFPATPAAAAAAAGAAAAASSSFPSAAAPFSGIHTDAFARPRDKVLGGGYVFPTQPVAGVSGIFQHGQAGGQGLVVVGGAGGAGRSAVAEKQELHSQSVSPEISRPAAPRPGASFRQSFDRRSPPPQSPPSRSHSRNTLASIGSFSLQQLPSPLPRGESADKSPPHPSRVVSSVLESFDPSFLNSLPANQIDDLENALLPHLNQEESSSQQTQANLGSSSASRAEGDERSNGGADKPAENGNDVPQESEEDPGGGYGSKKETRRRVAEEAEASSHCQSSSVRPGPEPLEEQRGTDSKQNADRGSGVRLASAEDIARCAKAAAQRLPFAETAVKTFSQLLPAGNQDFSATPVRLTPSGPRVEPDAEPGTPGARPAGRESGAAEEEENADESFGEDCCESEREYNESLVIDEANMSAEEAHGDPGGEGSGFGGATSKRRVKSEGTEISVNLETVKEGKSFKFAIPGSSKYVSLNFSADALLEMRNSVKKSGRESEVTTPTAERDEVTSSTTEEVDGLREQDGEGSRGEGEEASGSAAKGRRPSRNRRHRKVATRAVAKSKFRCTHCSKVYPSKALLDKHLAFHVTANVACAECGKVFLRRWQLEQHRAISHGRDQPVNCDECGKEFRWRRNLLAHLQLYHQKEKRHRCKFCPLTFLQRKSYINHQRSKHAKQPPTWCKVSPFQKLYYISRS